MEIAQIYYKQPNSGYSNQPLKVNNSGYYKDTGRNIHISDEYYDDYLIIYNYEGEIEVGFNYDFTRLKSGDIAIIPPKTCHRFSYFNRENNKYYWCHFSGSLASNLADEIIKKYGKTFTLGRYANIAQIFEKIYISMVNSSEQITNDLLYTVLFAINALIDNNLSENNYVIDVLKALIYIQNNYNKNITVEELSKMNNSSKYNFMRKFKSVTGSSVHQFIIDYRMMQAKHLLLNSDMNIKEISHQVGFPDNMYFSRAFKKYCGCNPTEYKYSVLKND